MPIIQTLLKFGLKLLQSKLFHFTEKFTIIDIIYFFNQKNMERTFKVTKNLIRFRSERNFVRPSK